MKPVIVVLGIILLGCSNLTLIRKDTGNETTVASNDDDPDKIICADQRVLGSNITQRVCRTVRQIEEEEQASKRDLKREIDRINRLPQGTGD